MMAKTPPDPFTIVLLWLVGLGVVLLITSHAAP